jgi:hypothetical protein
MYDRIMILPTSAAPRNPPPQSAPVFNGLPGGVRPVGQPDDPDAIETDVQTNEGVPIGRVMTVPRPVGLPPVPPPVAVTPFTDQQQPPQQPMPGVVATPANPFGLPSGSSLRPGVITPAAPPPTQQAPPGPGQE